MRPQPALAPKPTIVPAGSTASDPVFDHRSRSRIRRKLLAWYRVQQRDLPWRHTRDPYRIWLSETMLQQTRVENAIPYYERFLERFPDLASLATADEDQVLKEWAGLGYYARARNLKRAAETIVRDFGGEVPRDPERLRALPGIGPYTSGAIRSIAFGEEAPIVDGNVRRVFSRLLAEKSPHDRLLWRAAQELVLGEDPGLLNQSLMELGATLCSPRRPNCRICPIRDACRGRAAGDPSKFPEAARRKAPRAVQASCAVLRRSGRPSQVLLMRRPSRGLLGGLWELPSHDSGDAEGLAAAIRDRSGLRAEPRDGLGEVRHAFTHLSLTLSVIEFEHVGGRLRRGPAEDGSRARWCGPAERRELALSALMQKTLSLAGL